MAKAKLSIGYVTFKNKRQAENICKVLLDNDLIACANILQQHTAMYSWKNKTVKAKEVAAIIKTQKNLEAKVSAKIKELHSYEVPCIVFWSFKTSVPEFANWIESETQNQK